MPDITCELERTVNLANMFKITLIEIGDGVVKLRVDPCDDHILRAECFLSACYKAKINMEELVPELRLDQLIYLEPLDDDPE